MDSAFSQIVGTVVNLYRLNVSLLDFIHVIPFNPKGMIFISSHALRVLWITICYEMKWKRKKERMTGSDLRPQEV